MFSCLDACHDCGALAEETRRCRNVPNGASLKGELLVKVFCSGQVSVNVEHAGLSQQDDWACDSESEGLKFVETSVSDSDGLACQRIALVGLTLEGSWRGKR